MHLGYTTTFGLLGGLFVGGSSLISYFSTPERSAVMTHKLTLPQPIAHATVLHQEAFQSPEQLSAAEETLKTKVEMLREGRRFLESIPTYSAKFRKQEVVDGERLDEQEILLKYRREPASIYLRWLSGEKGREVLYVEGTNEGRLLAHDGGWKARIPAFSLAPHSSMAMQDTRYPVTDAGFEGLINQMLNAHEPDLGNNSVASCEIDSAAEFQGRQGVLFTTLYRSPEVSPVYRKSVTFIDQAWKLPLKSHHYEWPHNQMATATDLDDETLIEAYEFTEIDFDQQLQEIDFDRENPEYQFR